MGDINYINDLKKMVENMGLENYIIWKDFVVNCELYKYYSVADIGIWPKHISITRLEAMSCELPVIVNYSKASLEWLTNKNGLTYETGNINNLFEKMYYLIINEEKRIQMGKRARYLVEQDYSWDIIAKKFIDLVN